MKKDKVQLDELFRSKLENFEQEPPSYVWSRIQEQQSGKKRRTIFFYVKGAGIAAAVLLAFILGWQLQQSDENSIPVLTEQHEPGEKASSTPIKQVEEPKENELAENMDEAKPKVSTPGNQVFAEASQKSGSNQTTNRKTENENIAVSFTASTDVSEQREQIEQLENRKQETESFSLLKLLGIELDASFDEHAQLAEMKEEAQPVAPSLSQVERSTMEENARLMASNDQASESGSWQIGAMLTPGYAVGQSSQSQEYASTMTYTGSNEELNLGAGISVEYKTGKRWSIQSGVFYSELGQTSSNQAYRSSEALYDYVPVAPNGNDGAEFFTTAVELRSGEVTMNTAAGVIAIENLPANAKLSNGFESADAANNLLLAETEFEQNFEYIEIPLIFRYQVFDAAFDMQLLGGISTSILVGNEAYANNQDGHERIGETRDMNKFNYSTSFGLGFAYGISDKISIRIEPQVKYFLGSLNSNSDVNYKPYTIGVYTGLSYEF